MNTFHFVRQWVRDHPARAGTLSGWFQQGCGLAATFFTIPALLNPAMLAPHESGLWFAFQGLLAMVNLTDFGLGMVIARQAAYTFRRTGDHNPAAANDFIPLEAGWAGLAQLYQVAKRLFARL